MVMAISLSGLLSDPLVMAGLGALVGGIIVYLLRNIKIGMIPSETVSQVLIGVLKSVEKQAVEGTTVDTFLDSVIAELDKTLGNTKEGEAVIQHVKEELGNE